jgi:MrfA Zn-binding domain
MTAVYTTRPGGRGARRDLHRVGELRPSQLLYSFGVGAVVDLPHLSVIVMGVDDWEVDNARAQPISEERLLAAVRHQLGNQVSALRNLPYLPDTGNPFEEWATVGIPVAVFPRWLRCPRCSLLAPIATGLFELRTNPVRADLASYVHTSCPMPGKPPAVLAARFLLACPAGHQDDFPWVLFTHRGAPCGEPILELLEPGVSGRPADVIVRCRSCPATRNMVQAFGEEARTALPACRGRHPHLGTFEPGCEQPVRTILLGASNSWFPVTLAVLSIPESSAPLIQRVIDRWAELQEITSLEVLRFARGLPQFAAFAGYSDEDLWAAIEARRHPERPSPVGDPTDLLSPEWAAFSDPAAAPSSDDFRLHPVDPPSGLSDRIGDVVLAERLREVVALVGFTRVDAPDEVGSAQPETPYAALSRGPTLWVPCVEVRGEGVFLRLAEEPLVAWERRLAGSDRDQQFVRADARWRYDRGLDPSRPWPGLRYVLLHTLSHALMRQFALECGYGAAGLRERLYAEETSGGRMAGILLYTAAPDSEGTLGGLVELGRPDRLQQLFLAAIEQAGLCSSDPLCAEHEPGSDGSLHGAACHACLFASETSCERGNRYLDRTLLVDTFGGGGLAYFRSS